MCQTCVHAFSTCCLPPLHRHPSTNVPPASPSNFSPQHTHMNLRAVAACVVLDVALFDPEDERAPHQALLMDATQVGRPAPQSAHRLSCC